MANLPISAVVRGRAQGAIIPKLLQRQVSHAVFAAMTLAETKRLARVHTAVVCSLSIDTVQHRYLLSTGVDKSVQLFDLASTGQISAARHILAGSGHASIISSVEWYPVDNGMFSTASFDHTLRVWDAATMSEVCQFDLESRVYTQKMSSTGAHALIAAASESPYVRLCDLRNGAFAQSFIAHQSGSSAVAWSPQKPYELASGGLDGKLRVWDIRQTSSHVHEFGSSRKNGCAHDSIVSGLLIADDGLCLFSTGSDRRVCAWNIALPRSPMFDIGTGVDGGSNTSSINTVEMALTPGPNGTTSGAVLFIPSGNSRTVLAVSACTGEQLAQLDGHFGPSLTAAWQSTGNELYTGGTDSNVIAWCAREVLGRDQTELRVDSWSDNDANEDSA